MEKEDARKQSRDVLHERCKQVVRMHRKGVGVMQIVEQTGLSWTAVNTDVRGRSYAPAGKTPVTFAVGGTRHKLSMIATVTNQGKTRWIIIYESNDLSFSSDKLIEFFSSVEQRYNAQSVSDTGQLEGSPQQTREGLGA